MGDLVLFCIERLDMETPSVHLTPHTVYTEHSIYLRYTLEFANIIEY